MKVRIIIECPHWESLQDMFDLAPDLNLVLWQKVSGYIVDIETEKDCLSK